MCVAGKNYAGELRIVRYTDEYKERWDKFVTEESVNGTFLQTRRFLSYHPSDRFTDCSIIIFNNKGNIVAVCPACDIYDDGKRVFFSHKGSTYGGLVLGAKVMKAGKVIDIMAAVEEYAADEGFTRIVMKNTPGIFTRTDDELLEYVMYLRGFEEEKELNLYIDFGVYKQEVTANFESNKRTHVNKSIREGMTCRRIESSGEIAQFYRLLCENLEKYNIKPVHTFDEIMLLKDRIIPDECRFYGAFYKEEMTAGAMVFLFDNCNVAHTQYIASSSEYSSLSPATYMYYALIEEAKKLGYNKLSWGISSEHGGRELNYGLTSSKESYGSLHAVNRVFFKNL